MLLFSHFFILNVDQTRDKAHWTANNVHTMTKPPYQPLPPHRARNAPKPAGLIKLNRHPPRLRLPNFDQPSPSPTPSIPADIRDSRTSSSSSHQTTRSVFASQPAHPILSGPSPADLRNAPCETSRPKPGQSQSLAQSHLRTGVQAPTDFNHKHRKHD